VRSVSGSEAQALWRALQALGGAIRG